MNEDAARFVQESALLFEIAESVFFAQQANTPFLVPFTNGQSKPITELFSYHEETEQVNNEIKVKKVYTPKFTIDDIDTAALDTTAQEVTRKISSAKQNFT